jgi:hypothetical protein
VSRGPHQRPTSKATSSKCTVIILQFGPWIFIRSIKDQQMDRKTNVLAH